MWQNFLEPLKITQNRLCATAAEPSNWGCFVGGGYLSCVREFRDMDNRLAVFIQIKTGGCISGKTFFSIGQIFCAGQYNLEINFQFRNTVQFWVKKRTELSLRAQSNFYWHAKVIAVVLGNSVAFDISKSRFNTS